jgi:iron complex transport system substrate-binding protein
MNLVRIVARSFRTSALLVALAGSFAVGDANAQQKFVDDAKRTVALPAKVSRVFAAGAPAEVLLYTLVPEKMVGRNHMPSPAALEFMPPEYRNPTPISLLPNANDDRKDKELLTLKPDVYVDYGDVKVDYVNSLNNVQARTGIPGIILDGGLQQIPGTYRRLGIALGVKSRGDQTAKTVAKLLAKYRGVLAKSGNAPRAYLSCSGDNVIPCLAEQRSGEVMDFIGAANVAGTGATAPMRPVTPDDLKAWDPDAIIVLGKESAARIRDDAGWKNLRAVTEQHLYAFPAVPFTWGPRPPSVNRLLGMIWMAYVIPGKPFDKAFYDDVRGVFKTLYHFDPTDEQLHKLVEAQ